MILATYKTDHGATVEIRDDYMAARGSVEERTIIHEQRTVAYKILLDVAKRGNTNDKSA